MHDDSSPRPRLFTTKVRIMQMFFRMSRYFRLNIIPLFSVNRAIILFLFPACRLRDAPSPYYIYYNVYSFPSFSFPSFGLCFVTLCFSAVLLKTFLFSQKKSCIRFVVSCKSCTFAPAFGKEAGCLTSLEVLISGFRTKVLKKKLLRKFGRYAKNFLPLQPLSIRKPTRDP